MPSFRRILAAFFALLLLCQRPTNAQTPDTPRVLDSVTWTHLGAPPPRVTGIVGFGDAVLISTETGAYTLRSRPSNDGFTSWEFAPDVPAGRVTASRTGDAAVVGARGEAWIAKTNESLRWRKALENEVSDTTQRRTPPILTEARLRISGGRELIARAGGAMFLRLDSSASGDGAVFPLFSPLQNDDEVRARSQENGVVGLARAGDLYVCALERGVLVGEEMTVEKANPLQAESRKRWVWRFVERGLAASPDADFVVAGSRLWTRAGNLSSQGAIWNGFGKEWTPIADTTARHIVPAEFSDSSLAALSERGILRAQRAEAGSARAQAGFAFERFALEFLLPDTLVWYRDIRNGDFAKPIATQNGEIVCFARDARRRTLAPTHRIVGSMRSATGEGAWKIEIVQGLPDNFALGKVEMNARGALFAADRAFQRNAIARSRDGGRTWQIVPTGREPERICAAKESETILLPGAPPMISRNDGDSWTPALGTPFRAGGRFEGATLIAFGNNNEVAMLIRGVGLFVSFNGGANFASFPLGEAAKGMFDIVFAGDGVFIAVQALEAWNAGAAQTNRDNAATRLWAIRPREEGVGIARVPTPAGLPANDFLCVALRQVSPRSVVVASNRGFFQLDYALPSLALGFSGLTPAPNLYEKKPFSLRILSSVSAHPVLEIDLAEEAFALVVVADIAGARAPRIVLKPDNLLPAGKRHFELAGAENVATQEGGYVCRVSVNGREETRLFFLRR